jgi:hypothetical protein
MGELLTENDCAQVGIVPLADGIDEDSFRIQRARRHRRTECRPRIPKGPPHTSARPGTRSPKPQQKEESCSQFLGRVIALLRADCFHVHHCDFCMFTRGNCLAQGANHNDHPAQHLACVRTRRVSSEQLHLPNMLERIETLASFCLGIRCWFHGDRLCQF